jgi:hypothetical protein
MVILKNGSVLVAGGVTSGTALDSTELFNPTTNTFSATVSLLEARYGEMAVVLNDGRVLVAGGWSETDTVLKSAEIYG